MHKLTEYWVRARQMPIRELIKKVCWVGKRYLNRTLTKQYFLGLGISSFGDHRGHIASPVFLASHLDYLNQDWESWEWVLNQIMDHRFNLLGSGWTQVSHQITPLGVEGNLYSQELSQELIENWRSARHINRANREMSRRLMEEIHKDYQFIDWHVDFKSGYRWEETKWWTDIPYGHKPGVDIKVPWELSRMQHLPWLTYGFQKTGDQKYFREYCGQIFDFMANNPPGFGVNWKCPMDVAIRAANWILAYELFSNLGVSFPKTFIKYFMNSLIDHGKFIEQNFENPPGCRGNHYLANIAGLTFIAYFIQNNKEASGWKKLCRQELLNEARYQFHSCGTNFEGSTAYHRLSSEMLYYPILYILLHEKEPNILQEYPSLVEQIWGMAAFSRNITKPNGLIAQIGDNDSGRLFKLKPRFLRENGQLHENHLDVSHITSFTKALFEGKASDLESSIICNSLKKAQRLPFLSVDKLDKKHTHQIKEYFQKPNFLSLKEAQQVKTYQFPINPGSMDNIQALCYQDFGLVIYRSDSFFLSLRCGPIGQLGRGGHDHNDQLSIEFFEGGQDIIRDPGTYLYTPSPHLRNQYRSNQFHHCPQPKNREMSGIDKALFFLESPMAGSILSFQERACLCSFDGFGFPIFRQINLHETKIEIRDYFFSDLEIFDLKNFKELPYSPGYGIIVNG